eukprot:6413859-Pyramimonas_sp.AAC.1
MGFGGVAPRVLQGALRPVEAKVPSARARVVTEARTLRRLLRLQSSLWMNICRWPLCARRQAISTVLEATGQRLRRFRRQSST